MRNICAFVPCGRLAHSFGFCRAHHEQRLRGQAMYEIPPSKAARLEGQRFGRLTVIERRGSQNMKAMWLCRCNCGGESLVATSSLRNGNSTSCGCYSREVSAVTGRESIKAALAVAHLPETIAKRTKHGATKVGVKSSEYQTWKNMITRCTNPRSVGFKNYGGRGIRVCEEWRRSFSAFLIWLGPKPTPLHTIDRIDNDGNYEPGNVRWATRLEQAQNRRLRPNQTPPEIVRKIIALRGHFAAGSIAEAFGLRAGCVYETWHRARRAA